MSVCCLLDLPSDVLSICLAALTGPPELAVAALCALAAACRHLQRVVDALTDRWKTLANECYPGMLSVPRADNDNMRWHLSRKLADWRSVANGIEQPTLQQMVACVERAATAHSYYKHLNLGRSAVFSFSLSRVAGMRPDGHGGYVEYVRGDGTEFHYTWMETRAYHERFGFLVYSGGCSGGNLAPSTQPMHMVSASAEPVPMVPAYVVSSGIALCSAAVHGVRDFYTKAFDVVCCEGTSALEGRFREADVCDDRLQSRHLDAIISLPPELLATLDALASWRAPLQRALSALGVWREGLAIRALVQALAPYLSMSSAPPMDTGAPKLQDSQAASDPAPTEPLVPAARPPALRRRFSSSLSLRLSGRLSVSSAPGGTSEDIVFSTDALIEAARVLRELCTVIFPALRGRAWRSAALHIVPMAVCALVAEPSDNEVGCHGDLAVIASFAQTVAERHAMLEAVARVCGHMRGDGDAAVDLSPVYDEPSLYRILVGCCDDF